jgi:LPXTG-site transpeptidase (sortase) family protein
VDHDPAGDSDAFDLLLTDTVPSALAYVPGSLSLVSGQPPTALDESAAPTLRVAWDTFVNGGPTSVIQFQARLLAVPAGTTITNSADLEWSSLPGTVTSPQSAYNSLSTERYYDPGSSVDTYGVTSSVSINVVSLPSTGFASGRITVLPPDPGAYSLVGDLRLEVPRLGLLMPIVGVPLAESGWDVTWLGWQAGYLEGTAFPTWPGNSALTGHVYLADGTPGPFFGLGSMHWGDQIIVHAYGQRSVYEVRQVSLVAPNDVSVLGHESLSWLTLITCSGFDEARDAYRSRTVVRAVLVEVEDEGTQRP